MDDSIIFAALMLYGIIVFLDILRLVAMYIQRMWKSKAYANQESTNVPVPILESRQNLTAPCLGLGAHEAIAASAEFSLQVVDNAKKMIFLL